MSSLESMGELQQHQGYLINQLIKIKQQTNFEAYCHAKDLQGRLVDQQAPTVAFQSRLDYLQIDIARGFAD